MKAGKGIAKGVLLLMVTMLVFSPLWARNERDTLGLGVRILFSENRGQWEERVLYRSQMGLATMFAERDCFTFVLQDGRNANLRHPVGTGEASGRYRTHAYRVVFEGSGAKSVAGEERQEGVEHYYLGNDESRWATGVGVYGALHYVDLWPGVDMKVYTATSAMKYDFVVKAGGDARSIVMRYEGVDGLRLKGGDLIVRTSVLDVVEMRPYAYQMRGEEREEVASRFVLEGDRVRVEVGDYDQTRELIVDPLLYFSTYTGSSADNWGTTGCYDSEKNVYTSGVVFGTGYPVSLGAYDGSYNGNCDIGIFKFDPTGTTRLYATYLGGAKADMPHSMFVNSFDELVIFGTTGSGDFPVTSTAYDMTFNGGDSLSYEGSTTINFPNGVDLFVCRFNAAGSQLQASTYVGGSGNDGLNYRNWSSSGSTIMMGNDSLYYNYGDGARGELITDDLNNIYVGTTTKSSDFPVTENCIQSTKGGGQDGVVFKIDYNLSNMMWSTYLGGMKDDAIYSIDCDGEYNVVVSGGTNSTNFPTTEGAYKTSYQGGSADAFVAKISYYGSELMASTLFGSGAYDQSYFVRCGKSDDVFLFGQTEASGSTLVNNANYNTPNSGQFLARLRPGLDTLVWSTVFGDGSGEPNISPTAFAVDICNRIYLSGWGRIFLGKTYDGTYYAWNTHGTSNLVVTSDAYQSTTDGQDFYVMSLDMDANAMVYATFFGEQHTSGGSSYSGSDHVDGGTSRFDRLGTLYQSVCASCGGGDDFPTTTGAYSTTNNCSYNCNNAIFRLNLTDDFPVAEFALPVAVCATSGTVSFKNTGRGDDFLWDFGDGDTLSTTSTATVTHTYSTPGQYTVTLIAHMEDGCREYDTTTHPLMVLGNQTYELDTMITCTKMPTQIGLVPSLGCSYHWLTEGVSDSTIANPIVTTSGTYVLIVTDTEGGCVDTVYQVVGMGEADATIAGDTVTCDVPTEIEVDATGSNLTFQWSSKNDMSDTLNNDLQEGTYSFSPTGSQWYYLQVTDNFGCVKIDSIHIRYYQVLDTVVTTSPLCPGENSGQACCILTDSAVAPYHYNWGNGWVDTDCYTQYAAGMHTLKFKDANGCEVSTNFTIEAPEGPEISVAVEHNHCLDSCMGTITVSVSGPSEYTLMWQDDSSTTTTRSDLCPGVYVLEVRDTNGCVTYDSIEVLENVDMSVAIETSQNSCEDICSGTAVATITGGTPPYEYHWSSGENSATATELCPGTAIVTATDSYGCQVRDSIEIAMQHSFDAMQAWADDEYVFKGKSTTLHVSEIPYGQYHWQPLNPHPMVPFLLPTIDNATSSQTTVTLYDTTLFVVTVTDSLGCTWSDTVKVACVDVDCGETNIFIPNAFTPNNDGKNDQLCFRGEWVQEFHITIFTRWGEKVYESDDLNECWDGRFRGNWCMPGVYVYYCRIYCADGEESTLKGDITLIR